MKRLLTNTSLLAYALLTVLMLTVCDQSSSHSQKETHKAYLDEDTSDSAAEYHANRLEKIQAGLKK